MNYYKNENPGDGSEAVGGGHYDTSVIWGKGWVDADDFFWVKPQEEDDQEVPGWFYSGILRKNGPWLLLDGTVLLSGTTPCKNVPLLVTISGENHSDCLRLEIPKRSLNVIARDKETIYARFDFTTPGTIEVFAKWQPGHYDHEKIHSAEFKILGKSYGVKRIPLGEKILVAKVEIV